MAVAVFKQGPVLGEVVAKEHNDGVQLKVHLMKLPSGKHGFHIHTAGDLRGEGCQGACSHWSKTPSDHGDYGKGHTGDLGNVEPDSSGQFKKTYFLKGVGVEELWGRTVIVHEDEDDLGHGGHKDSKTTGNSGKRIACAIFGRMKGCEQKGGGLIEKFQTQSDDSTQMILKVATTSILLGGFMYYINKRKNKRFF